MFSTFKQKLLLGVYIFILISIPLGAYLGSQTQIFKSNASEPKQNSSTGKKGASLSTGSPAKDLLSATESNIKKLQDNFKPSPTPLPSDSPTVATSFGPTLSFKVSLEGRPVNNQSGKMFVGIAEGSLATNPKFLLSFTVDLPSSGYFANLSLAGLNPGTRYTALLKGSAQIATSSAFIMSPTVSNLNDSQAVNLLAGDLNEDNVVNSSDYAIVQKAFGSTATSANWNELADLNKDGTVNAFDLSLVAKNLGRVGDSGAWTSPIPKNASPSASLTNQPSTGGPDDSSGYWMWIPK